MFTLSSVPGLKQFLIATIDNYTRPLRLAFDFIDLYTDFGISAHPHYFLPERGEDIDEIRLACKANRHYVWLITQRATKPSERCVGESLAALLLRHLIDKHVRSRFVGASDGTVPIDRPADDWQKVQFT
jgi:hypothetical protein